MTALFEYSGSLAWSGSVRKEEQLITTKLTVSLQKLSLVTYKRHETFFLTDKPTTTNRAFAELSASGGREPRGVL